jgi:uncharacterized protein (DUF885 family)
VAFLKDILDELGAIDRAALDEEHRINYDIFKQQLQNRIENFELRGHLIPLTVDNGFHIAFARLPKRVPLTTVEDYDNYIARLLAYPAYVEQHIELMRAGLESGMTLPKVVLNGYEVTIETHVVDEPQESIFFDPFDDFPATLPPDAAARLTQEGRRAVMEGAVKGYRAFLDFMGDEYIPNARESIGAYELLNGREYYQHTIRFFTTLDMTPDEIHALGLKEVERIKSEMLEIIQQVGFRGSFAAFLKFLRTDPRFYAQTPDELLKEASFIAKRMDAKLPSLFKTLPRLPYGVAPVPDHLAPKYTGGRYVGPALGSTEPGYYWVNTFALDSRPLYVLESLTLHEAVPGHHLQNAIAREKTNLPNFRRFSYISAFGEGWGLYSEWLGLEAGFYEDPYSNFGRLTYEMWRACRLVVDTGMHSMGWTRQQSIDFLASNTALSLHECTTETDRYISWPGQALAYKLGELKIKELRREAEQALGQSFDVREFHDVILMNGSVPLTVLEDLIRSYIKEKDSAERS